MVVLVVFPALAYAGVTWLSDWDGLPSLGATETTAPPDDEPEVDATETPVETTAPEATPAATAEATPEPPPLDLARTVEVDNATRREGLAGRGRDRLEAAGFTSVSTGNWSGDAPAAAVVYYAAAADITTAQQVAVTLGIATVTESAELAPEGILVVLTEEYVEP